MHSFATLRREFRKKPLFNLSELPVREIAGPALLTLIEHRDPFVFIDKITAVDKATLRVAGERMVQKNDPVFQGHFPNDPTYPGVLIVESLGQLAAAELSLHEKEGGPCKIRATKIHGVDFFDAVRPGDTITLLGYRVEFDGIMARFVGQALVGKKVVALIEGELCVME